MYVRWKILLFFGFIFWLLNCITDYFRLQSEVYHGDLFQELMLEEKEPEPKRSIENVILRVIALVLSVVLLIVSSKMALNKFAMSFRANWVRYREPPVSRASCSRIPKPLDQNKTARLKHSQTSVSSPQTDSDSPSIHSGKAKFKSNRQLEKHCARLREEILVLQTTSSQEHQNLINKIETISKEKHKLHKRLAVALKENQAAKQQLEDVLCERTLLIKRLESATEEIKINTKAKKNTLSKLEEALANMDKLKIKLEEVTRDKEILENKLSVLEKEYHQLKEQAYLYALNMDVPENEKEHAVDVHDCGDCLENYRPPVTQIDDFDISQSEREIKKVQEKLMYLEKSLENMKMCEVNQCSDDLDEKWITPMNDIIPDVASHLPPVQEEDCQLKEDNLLNSICNEPECQLEHQECTKPECLLQYSQNVNIPTNEELLGAANNGVANESKEIGNYLNIQYLHRARPNSFVEYEDRLLSISEHSSPSPSTDLGDENDDEPKSDYVPQQGLLTTSPLFLDFLEKCLQTPM